MVRRKVYETWEFRQYQKKSWEDKSKMANVPNSRYAKLLTEMRGWILWSERGIAIPELASIPAIQATIRDRQWDLFTATPGHYDPVIVREFYAALSPPVFHNRGVVIVRGQRVEITQELINLYFRSPPAPETDLTGGLIDHEFFTGADGRLEASLCRDVWIPGDRDLEYSSLRHELAVWTLFIKSNIFPSNDGAYLSPDVAQCLYSIQQGLPIDVGDIVLDQILDAAMGNTGILPFPCMITHFCWVAGIKVFETHRSHIAPVCNIGRTDYNNFARTAGLDEIPCTDPTQKRHNGVEEGTPIDDMPEAPHVDPAVDMPAWAQMICSTISSQIDDMRSHFDARFSTIETRLVAVETACRELQYG